MAQDESTLQQRLTPEGRRALLRDFADRMLLKVAAMDDPEDLPGVERAVRTAAAIERIYSRCDRAEAHAPDPRKLEAERTRHADEATKARVTLAGTLEWADKRRKALGPWWEAADTSDKTPAPAPLSVSEARAPAAQPATKPSASAIVDDYSDAILAVRAKLGLKDLLKSAGALAAMAEHPPP